MAENTEKCKSEHICLCSSLCAGYSEHNPGPLSKAKCILEKAFGTGDWSYVLDALMHVDDCPLYFTQLRSAGRLR